MGAEIDLRFAGLFDFQLLKQDYVSSFYKQKLVALFENCLKVLTQVLVVYRIGLKFFCKALIISPEAERENSFLLPGPYAFPRAYCWPWEAISR